MKKLLTSMALCVWLLAWLTAAVAEGLPAKGKLLVATDKVRGEIFARTVILLLHYDEDGAMGIVVNRPTDIPPGEVLTSEAFEDYGGELYWGGPVQMDSLWALILSDDPPDGANTIVDAVHHVPIDGAVERLPADPSTVRFFIGYAGWAPGQLEGEIARGDWHVVQAASEIVFSDAPRELWKRLGPPGPQLRASADRGATQLPAQ